ncbi:IS66 family insertion sequence element accessory protein TnpB [Azotobacter beijerinckii]
MSVLVHDGVGVWLTARRLHQGRFFLPGVRHGAELELDAGHFIESDS